MLVTSRADSVRATCEDQIMISGRNPAKTVFGIVGFFVLALAGFDVVRAYWLPIELNNAMGGHYLFSAVSSTHGIRKGLSAKKRDWRKRDIEFSYYIRRSSRGTRIRGDATVKTRFLKYAGLETITVSMDRDLVVTQSGEIQEFISDMMDKTNRISRRARP